MKKLMCLLLVSLLLAGCTQESETKEISVNAYLVQNANYAAEELYSYMQNGSLISMFTSSAEIHGIVQELESHLQGEPDSAVIFQLDPEAIDNILKISDSDAELTEQEDNFLNKRFIRAIPSMINGRSGAELLAATSALTVDKSALSHSELAENTAVILLYKDGYGISAVFLPSEDGTVLISASCLKFPDGEGIEKTEQLIAMMEETMGIKIFNADYIEKTDLETLLGE